MLQAKEIVIREDLPKGEPPLGMHYNSQNITHEFFSQTNEELRDQLVERNMPFLHAIVSAKLEHASVKRERKRQASNVKRDVETHVTTSDELGDLQNFEPGSAMGQTIKQLEIHRIRKV